MGPPASKSQSQRHFVPRELHAGSGKIGAEQSGPQNGVASPLYTSGDTSTEASLGTPESWAASAPPSDGGINAALVHAIAERNKVPITIGCDMKHLYQEDRSTHAPARAPPVETHGPVYFPQSHNFIHPCAAHDGQAGSVAREATSSRWSPSAIMEGLLVNFSG